MQKNVLRCPKCDTENPVGAKFCMQCGAKLENLCPKFFMRRHIFMRKQSRTISRWLISTKIIISVQICIRQ